MPSKWQYIFAHKLLFVFINILLCFFFVFAVEDIAHTITMTLKTNPNAIIQDVRLTIDNYIRDLQARSITSSDHQVSKIRKTYLS